MVEKGRQTRNVVRHRDGAKSRGKRMGTSKKMLH